MKYIVLEIPHRLPPIAWPAEDESDFIGKVNASSNCMLVDTFDDALDECFYDLYHGCVMTESEARQYVGTGHQGIKAEIAVEKVLEDYFCN